MTRKKFTGKIKDFFAKDKRRIYMASGLGCLVIACAVIIGMWATSANASTENITLNTTDFRLETVTENDVTYYIIDDQNKMKALFNAADYETEGKHFRLSGDLTVDSITEASIGTFAGELDGQGYVLTLKNIEVVSAGYVGNTENLGILFGEIASTGKITNLIIDLPNGGSITRTSQISTTVAEEVTEDSTEGVSWDSPENGTDELVYYKEDEDGNPVYAALDTYASDDAAAADGFTEKAYKHEYVTTGTKTVTAGLENADNFDTFGIVCGKNEGSVSEVYITGDNTFTVTGYSERNLSSATVYTASKTDAEFYDVEYKTPNVDPIELSSTNTSVSNEYISGNLEIRKVPETGEGKSGKYCFVYDLELTNNNTSSGNILSNELLITDLSSSVKNGDSVTWYLNEQYSYTDSDGNTYTTGAVSEHSVTNPTFSSVKYDGTNSGILLESGESIKLFCRVEELNNEDTAPNVYVKVTSTTVTKVSFDVTLENNYTNQDYSSSSGTASVNVQSSDCFDGSSVSNNVNAGSDDAGYSASITLPNVDGTEVSATLSVPAKSDDFNNSCVVSVELTNKTNKEHIIYVSDDWTDNTDGKTKNSGAANGYAGYTVSAGKSVKVYKYFSEYNTARTATISVKGWTITKNDTVGYGGNQTVKDADSKTISAYTDSTDSNTRTSVAAKEYVLENKGYLTSTLYIPGENLDTYNATYIIQNKDTQHSYKFTIADVNVNGSVFKWTPQGGTASTDGTYIISAADSSSEPATLTFTLTVPESVRGESTISEPTISGISIVESADNFFTVSVGNDVTDNEYNVYSCPIANVSNYNVKVYFDSNYDIYNTSYNKIDSIEINSKSYDTVIAYDEADFTNLQCVSYLEYSDGTTTKKVTSNLGDYIGIMYSCTIASTGNDYDITLADGLYDSHFDRSKYYTIKSSDPTDLSIYACTTGSNPFSDWSFIEKIVDSPVAGTEYEKSTYSDCFTKSITNNGTTLIKTFHTYSKEITVTMTDSQYDISLDLSGISNVVASDKYGYVKTGTDDTTKNPSNFTSGGWYCYDTGASLSTTNGNLYLKAQPGRTNTFSLIYVSTTNNFSSITSTNLSSIEYVENTSKLTLGSTYTLSKKSYTSGITYAKYICELNLKVNSDEYSSVDLLSVSGLSSWTNNSTDASNNNISSPVYVNQYYSPTYYKAYTGYSNAVQAAAVPEYSYPAFVKNNYSPASFTSEQKGYTSDETMQGYISGELTDVLECQFVREYEKYVDTVVITNNSNYDVVINDFNGWSCSYETKTYYPAADSSSSYLTIAPGKSATFTCTIGYYPNAVKAVPKFSGTYTASVTSNYGSVQIMSSGKKISYAESAETVVSTTDTTATLGSYKDRIIGLNVTNVKSDKTDYLFYYELLLACSGNYSLKNISILTNDTEQALWANASVSLAKNGIMITSTSFSDEKSNATGKPERTVTVGYEVDSVRAEKGVSKNKTVSVVPAKIDVNNGKASTELLNQGGFALYAGGVCGANNGTVTEVKYSLPITFTFAKYNDGTDNNADLGAGGNISGLTLGSSFINNIYMTVSGKYAGKDINGSVTDPAYSCISSELIKTQDAAALTGSNAWGEYLISSTSGTTGYYDLKWLIKKCVFDGAGTLAGEKDTFSAETVSGQQVTIASATANRSIKQGSALYNVRKSMTDTSENSIYYSRMGASDSVLKISLEESAFYRVVNVYETDGYYHYYYYAGDSSDDIAAALAKAAYYYPYSELSPYNTDRTVNPYAQETLGSDWTAVKRTVSTGNIQDVIEFTLPSYNGSSFGGCLYYTAESDATSTDIPDATYSLTVTGGKADIAYSGENVSYRVTPYENSHIYPTVSTSEFTSSQLGALPTPSVNYSGHFNGSGAEKGVQALTDGAVLFEGDEISFSVKGDAASADDYVSTYSIRYIISSTMYADDALSELDWSSAADYTGAITLENSLVGTKLYYVYAEISKGNYKSSYYNCGNFYVAQSSVDSSIYATSDAANEITGNALTGDIFRINDGIYNNCDIEYAFSATSVSSYDTLSWNTYIAGTVTLIDSSKPYVYMRVKVSNDNYGPVCTETYVFGSEAGSVRANPNAAEETNPIQNGTLCLITSYTNNADIYYLYDKTESLSTAPQISRVSSVPSDAVSGEKNSDGYTYIKSGERWYRSSSELKKYSSGVSLTNDTENTKQYSLYACSVAEDYTPGDFKCFSFYVTKMDQVCVPEATLPTKCSVDGNTDEIATVSLGDTVSFTSATPSNGSKKVTFKYSIDAGNTWNDVPETGVEVTGKYGGQFIIDVYATRTGMLDSEQVRFTYAIEKQGKVENVTSTPSTTDVNPTEVRPGDRILLSSTTAGVTIIYTTDETTPSYTINYADDGTVEYVLSGTTELYSAASGILMPTQTDTLDNYFTVYAIGIKDGLLDSDLGRFTFAYPDQVNNPYANVAAGDVALNTDIYLYSATTDATICYTIGYGDNEPADPTISSMVFNGQTPITITQKTTIKAIAFKNGVTSKIITFVYNPMTQLAAPTASISSGSVVSNGMAVKLTSGSATIFYTLDGSDPTDSTNTAVVSGNNVTLSGSAGSMIVVKAYASQSGYSNSETVTFTYQISEANGGITADIPSGSDVSSGTKVNLMTDVTGAAIYYIIGNGDPATQGTKGNTVTISGGSGESVMVKAVSAANGSYGTITTFVYHILEKPSEPVAYPSGGELTTAKYVILTSEAGDIYYTVDGTTPTTGSTLYKDPFLVNKTTTVKAIAVLENGEISDVATFTYIAAVKAEAPTFSVSDNEVVEPGTVVYLSTDTDNADIYYSLDGSEPSIDGLSLLSVYDPETGISVSRSVTVKAVSYREDLQLSDVSECNVVVETVPGQEIKQAQEEAEEAAKLHDSDTSGLDRNSLNSDAEPSQITLTEDVCNTSLSGADDVLSDEMSIETEKLGQVSKTIKNNVSYYYGDDYSVLSLYDTYLVSDDTHIQPEGEVEIGIPIPEGFENATLSLIHIDENGRITPLKTRRQDNMLYATVSELNLYGVVGIESEKTSSSSFPMLIVLEVVAGMFACGGAAFAIVTAVKKKRKIGNH